MKNLFSFITLLILVHTTTEAHPDAVVLDTDGNELLTGYLYYVVPLTGPGHGSGIVQYSIPNKACSYGVSQLLYGEGIPLIFMVVNSSVLGRPIYDFYDLDISFSRSIGCGSTDVWKRGEYENGTKQYFVTIDGAATRILGNGTIGNAFHIIKAVDDFYKFVFCPETCRSCRLICYDIGIFHQDGVRRLAESGDTSFLIKFRKYVPELELVRY